MKQLQEKLLALLLMALLSVTGAYAQETLDKQETPDKVVIFRFLPGEEMFSLKGNEAELERLYALVDEYRTDITAGRMPVYVDGYCASMPTAKENFDIAYTRANRVKSELITQKGLKEADFITANYARAYHNNKDVVVVTLRIPAEEQPDTARMERERREQAERECQAQAEAKRQAQAERERIEQERAQAETERAEREKAEAEYLAREQQAVTDAVQSRTETAEPAKPYHVAVRTNLLYDAMLLPTLGVEWRINEHVGIKLDGSLSGWGGSTGKVQKMWLVNPEVRWYLLHDKRFYVGASGTYGEYNIYKYALGSILSKDDTGYQGKLWNAGLTVGYQLPLSRRFTVDFNLGLGYTRSEYDSFTMTDGVRAYKERDRSKNLWGPTQVGISLVWTIGGNKQ
ncbi:DUF3575 domain-containing protein [Bacteroides thetaiotaomicron]|uniref:DUF3575 domain-containing protein n=1 Tax=Bacteroides thetaiotaomicron TaxID=818 RepID=UPI0034A107E9